MSKYLLLVCFSLFLFCVYVLYQYLAINDGKLHVVFCDVGQGDAILMKTPTNKFILIDAGPDKKVLDCLARHMPIWKRDIDLVLLTHPHLDHFMGFHYVAKRYTIRAFATESLKHDTAAFELLMQEFEQKKIKQQFVKAGDKWFMTGGEHALEISVEGPTDDFVSRTSPGGKIGETSEFASLITRVSYGRFELLLTGDAQSGQLGEVVANLDNHVQILQAPHHGSRTGLTKEIIEQLSPELAVISVGKNNYGHPSFAVLNLLKDIPIKRTDISHDVEIETNGNYWRAL